MTRKLDFEKLNQSLIPLGDQHIHGVPIRILFHDGVHQQDGVLLNTGTQDGNRIANDRGVQESTLLVIQRVGFDGAKLVPNAQST